MQSQFDASSLPATRDRVPHKAPLEHSALRLSRFLPNLALWMRKWYAVSRSFRGHIRFQFSTRTGWVDLGPVFRDKDGHCVADERTRARAEGIEKLLATHQWADSADRRIFLLGFEVGEQFGRGQKNCFRDSPESLRTC